MKEKEREKKGEGGEKDKCEYYLASFRKRTLSLSLSIASGTRTDSCRERAMGEVEVIPQSVGPRRRRASVARHAARCSHVGVSLSERGAQVRIRDPPGISAIDLAAGSGKWRRRRRRRRRGDDSANRTDRSIVRSRALSETVSLWCTCNVILPSANVQDSHFGFNMWKLSWRLIQRWRDDCWT